MSKVLPAFLPVALTCPQTLAQVVINEIAAANERGMAMICTGVRHFKH